MIDPGQSNPSAKGKEGRRYFIGCFSVLIELKRLILLRKTINKSEGLNFHAGVLALASKSRKEEEIKSSLSLMVLS